MNKEKSINWYAPANRAVGYGVLGTFLAEALDEKGLDVHYLASDSPEEKNLSKEVIKMLTKEVMLDIPSVHLAPGNLMWQGGGKPKIGYTLLEVDRIPTTWVKQLNQMDDVWATSNFCKEAFENSGVEKKVKVIPGGVDMKLFNSFMPSIPELKSTGTWKMFFVGKLETRKNIEGLCFAWQKANLPVDKTELFLMIDNPFVNINPFEFLWKIGAPKNIKLINRVPDYKLMPRLFTSMDAFITLSRGEGIGLPVLEAQACGLPSIVHNATGLKDYVSKDDTYLVETQEMVQADDPVFGFNFKQGKWAEPDINQAAELIRYVYEHKEEAEKQAQKAQKRVSKELTWAKSAEKVVTSLREYL